MQWIICDQKESNGIILSLMRVGLNYCSYWHLLAMFWIIENILTAFGGAILQVQLYEDFAKSRAKCDVDETVSSAALSEETEKPKLKATGHVFQV